MRFGRIVPAPFFRDARISQILFLTVFLFLGVAHRDWTIRAEVVAASLITCLAVQWAFDRNLLSLRSAFITALSLCLLLRVNTLWPMVLAGAVSIACKFFFRVRGKHFFNPSNFGLIAAIALTRDSWVSPGQWGQDLWVMLLVACLGGMVVHQVSRWETTGSFLAVYAGLEFVRNAWLGWTLDVFLQRMSSGSLILFAFFMITDPRAIPDRGACRIGWAAAVAALTFVLRNYFFLPTALFWSLFALSPLTVLLDRVWPAERFKWIPEGNREPLLQTVSLEAKPCA